MIRGKKLSFYKALMIFVGTIILFSCSSDTDKRDDILEENGEPDIVETGEYAGIKSEIYIYARKDINRTYEFQKTVSGCGGSSNWYLYRIYYTDALGYSLYLPPKIIHFPITSAPLGQVIPVSVVVTDDEQVVEVTLFYRVVGEEEYYQNNMTEGEENTYRSDIPAEAVTSVGVEYYIGANDGLYISALPEDDPYLISVSSLIDSIVVAPAESVFKDISTFPLPELGELNSVSPMSP